MNINDIQGWFDYANIYDRFAAHVADGGTIVELGVWKGRSIIHLSLAAKQLHKQVKIYGVDNYKCTDWDGYFTISRLDRERGEMRTPKQQCRDALDYFQCDNVTIIDADTIAAAEQFEDGSVDFLFVDATHTAEHVTAELKAWLPKMKRPTWIAGHDYPGNIKPAIDAAFPDHQVDGNCWIAFLK